MSQHSNTSKKSRKNRRHKKKKNVQSNQIDVVAQCKELERPCCCKCVKPLTQDQMNLYHKIKNEFDKQLGLIPASDDGTERTDNENNNANYNDNDDHDDDENSKKKKKKGKKRSSNESKRRKRPPSYEAGVRGHAEIHHKLNEQRRSIEYGKLEKQFGKEGARRMSRQFEQRSSRGTITDPPKVQRRASQMSDCMEIDKNPGFLKKCWLNMTRCCRKKQTPQTSCVKTRISFVEQPTTSKNVKSQEPNESV